ncbi:rust resistance kinase Lr10-like [Camellia sinensis]|uniref:rust resistance kinase Lr10-like n=1 Tax=Camellia sinensis TaxID=4442 RepID=UPI00103624DB|nr:rust resistance kinase Lr10-like [Camellia sinensis]
MAIFQGILLVIVLLLVPMAAAATVVGVGGGAEEQDPECLPTSCRKHHGPEIRFPFRLKGKQHERCGYPGFDLSCIHHSKFPVLDLPFSVSAFVKHIDYKSQTINISDSEPQVCLPRQLPSLNQSAFPFQFLTNYYYEDVSFINCSQTQDKSSMYQIACLSDQSHQVYAFITSYTWLLVSCTKMYNMSLPEEIFHYGYGTITFDHLQLNWSKPACGKCEAQGKNCGFKKNNNSSSSKSQLLLNGSTECFDKPRQPSTGALMKLKIAGEVLGPSFLLLVVIAIYHAYRSNKMKKADQVKIDKFLEDYKALKPARYSYADIKKITNQFEDKVGQGGYGIVYKGKLSNDVYVAVKILNNVKGNGDEFINEVQTMGRIHHINVVRLVGYCADGFRRALLYEFLPNNSLEKFIASNQQKRSLGWKKLEDIALGIAKGIEYLHLGCDQRILHFDIKPHNILLDNKFNPKISDFGLAKLCSKEQSAVSMTTARGTVGYIAPEVFSRNFGNVSYKSDVYSFGMLLLDMVGGRQNTVTQNTSECYFPEWIYKRLDQGEDLGIQIEEDGDAKIIRKLTIMGLWCIQWYPVDRPSMKVVVQMLEGDGDTLIVPHSPFASTNPMPMTGTTGGRTFNSELEVISESE